MLSPKHENPYVPKRESSFCIQSSHSCQPVGPSFARHRPVAEKVGLLAETLLEAATQDNAFTGGEVSRLRSETRALKSKLAQARRERALKAMGVRPTSAASSPGTATALPVLGAGAGTGTEAGEAEVRVCVFLVWSVFH